METNALNWVVVIGLCVSLSAAAAEAFKIQVMDRRLVVESPASVGATYSVEVQNRSLNDLMGKFHANGVDLKFVSVKAGASKVVEFKVTPKALVVFQPMAPASQQVELIVGKRTYEIPPQP
ncbi:MAG: hypothetical protein ACLGG7_11960 [Bacteriovoracia bacterium]